MPGWSDLRALAGRVLAGKYRLGRMLGQGGMGCVYQAEQLGLGRSVAIKLLFPERAEDRVERFRAEGVVASRINHPNAVAVYDFGVTDDNVPYLVMEHLRGETLAKLLAARPLSPAEIVNLGAQVLSALSEAHHCGVIHRDLTASNVIVERLRGGTDFAKVIDFGLAQLFGVPAADNAWYGTAEYVAPELIRGEAIGPSFDLYAMGIVLYEMIVGRTPFSGREAVDIVEAHMKEEPLSPAVLIPSCSQALSDVVMRALAKYPADRAPDAAAMREELLAALGTERQAALRCGSCDASAPAGARFCNQCGAAIGDGARERTRRQVAMPAVPALAAHTMSRLLARVEPTVSAALDDAFDAALARADDGPAEPALEHAALVGRREELGRVMRFCRGEAGRRSLAVVGPDGIGKARVILEAGARLADQVHLVWAGAHPQGLPLSWYPVATMLSALLDVPGEPTLEDLEAAIESLGLARDDAHAIAEIYGVAGPMAELELATRRGEVFPAVVRALVAGGSRHRGTVLVFDDLHRYDAASRRAIAELCRAAERAGDGPLVITTAKDETAAPSDAGRLRLSGLSPQESRELASALAGEVGELPSALAVHAVTAGSPATVVQLAGWLALGNAAADVPARPVDLVSVRVNRLGAAARRVLQAVALHGLEMTRAMLEELVPEAYTAFRPEDPAWTGLLVADGDGVRIASDLVAEVVVANIPADVRRALHKDALVALAPDAPDGLIGHHAEGAGTLHLAWRAYLSAGDDAVRRFDDAGAAHWYGRALAIARQMRSAGEADAGARFIDVAVKLADVMRYTGQLGLAGGVLDEAELADPDAEQRADIARARGRNELAAGNPGRAAQLLNRAIGLALRDGDRTALAETYVYLADALIANGEGGAAIEELEAGAQLLSLHDGGRRSDSKLWRLGHRLAELHLERGHLDAAARCNADALRCAEAAGSSLGRGRCAELAARIADLAGDPAGARRYRLEAIDKLRALGDRRTAWTLERALGRATDEGGGGDPRYD